MLSFLNTRHKDQAGGGLMVLIGLGALVQGSSYSFGSLARVGPGFFPVALGSLLGLLGLGMIATADKAARQTGEGHAAEWRGWGCIALSLVLFVTLGTYGGLLPATFAVVFVSALGDRRNSIKDALILACAIMVVSVAVFWWALQVQFPLFRWG
jgi:hypothetical protein